MVYTTCKKMVIWEIVYCCYTHINKLTCLININNNLDYGKNMFIIIIIRWSQTILDMNSNGIKYVIFSPIDILNM